jgi:hypothetical protein
MRSAWFVGLGLLGCQEATYRALPNPVTAVKPGDFLVSLAGLKLAPEIVLVVDRSVGMLASTSGDGPGCADALGHYTGDRTQDCKWNRTLDLLVGTASQPGLIADMNVTLSQRLRPLGLGLVFFPGDDTSACKPGSAAVAVTDDGVEALTRALLAARPAGEASTAETMAGLADVFPTETPARDHVALLVTGSTPACAGRDALVNVVDSLHENAHIPTLVLAVNPDATADETLRLTALAGGAPRYDSPSYFTPETPADLLSAFGPVPTGSAHCKYRLQAPVADPTLLEITATPSGGGADAAQRRPVRAQRRQDRDRDRRFGTVP